MPRKVPQSAKQHKANLQLKRAIKRGDEPAPPKAQGPKKKRGRKRIEPTGSLMGSGGPSIAAQSTRKLQSAFVTLTREFLEEARGRAAVLPLPSPLQPQSAILRDEDAGLAEDDAEKLRCPSRPKWNFDMTKTEVEANEGGSFRKWIAETDSVVEAWVKKGQENEKVEGEDEWMQKPTTMPRPPTYFERNLEVWRQLWRVTEISQILLVLLDSRAPSLHLPPSLATYLTTHPAPPIFVLTKTDISGPERAAAWAAYLRARFDSARVVLVEAYEARQDVGWDSKEAEGQGRKMYAPRMGAQFRDRLVEAIKEVHEELVKSGGRTGKDVRKLGTLKREVNWEDVIQASGALAGKSVGGAAAPASSGKETDEGGDESFEEGKEPAFLTVGLIGQPNVGKSSLLNALFGESRVRTSKTPGKTKHFQTLFWTSEVRLVDCPGLVLPSLVPLSTQVLAGIYPIARLSAIPSCIHTAAQRLPLVRIFGLEAWHPARDDHPEDKRTWRQGAEHKEKEKAVVWTAMDVLSAYAEKKGLLTAKAGRLDVNRAGNAMLRALTEGRVRWALWPPGTDIATIETAMAEPGCGAWIPLPEGGEGDDGEQVSADESEQEQNHGHEDLDDGSRLDDEDEDDEDEATDEEEEDSDEATGDAVTGPRTGVFAALSLQAEDEDSSEEESPEQVK